ANELGLFFLVDAREWAFVGGEAAHSHLDDRDEIVLLHEQINFVAPHSQVSLENHKAECDEMFLGGALGTISSDLFLGHVSLADSRSESIVAEDRQRRSSRRELE